MTEREAIEAIKGLENIIEYWTHRPGEVVTAKLAIQALEKQIGKKLKDDSVIDGFYSHEAYEKLIKVCGDCGNPYLSKCDKYCGECGQRIWWGE